MIIRILVIFYLFPVTLYAQENFSQAELQVKNMIKNLPEVKIMNNAYDSITKRVQEVKMRLSPPDDATGLYKVEVGYQGSGRFEPHYYFFVNPGNRIIYIEDMEYGDRPLLSEWRNRRRENAGSPDFHTPDSTLSPDPPPTENVYP